jgi:hypothetical protein
LAATNGQSIIPRRRKDEAGIQPKEFSMNLQSKLIGAVAGALVLLASPVVQAAPSIVTISATSAAQAANSAAQSAVRDAREDTARKVAQRTKTGIKTR